MTIEEIDKLCLEFLKNPIENNAINLLRCARSNNMFHLTTYIGKYMLKKFPYLLDVKDEYAISAYYCNDHESAFDNLQEGLELKGLSKDNSWKILFNQHFSIDHVCDRYIYYNKDIVDQIQARKKNNLPLVSFTITTCKRFDLFEKTINSFLNCVKDLNLIDFWYCIDDNSSDEDREKMKTLYPFFTFYFKSKKEKGHPQSLNIIRSIVKTPYILHLEDDWKFFVKRNYITDSLDVLSSNSKLGQCLFNKNYAEIESDIDIKGGKFNTTNNGIRFYIHEYARTEEEIKNWVKKHGTNKNSSYWPHFSFRPSLLKREIFNILGPFNEQISHFEMDYANRYSGAGYMSAFFEGIYCIHIGRLTSERDDDSKLNAYKLNDEIQFYGKEEKIKESSSSLSDDLADFKTFIVNLDRRPDRWENIKKDMPQFLKYERFSAVDGMKLNSSRQLQQIFENNDYSMRRGMVGCFMSHIKLFINLIKEEDKNIKYFMILEDDITFQDNFETKFKHLQKQIKDLDWDFVFLGHHVRDPNNPKYFDKSKLPEIEKINVYQSFIQSLGGTTGFLISRKGAEKFLNFLDRTGATNGIDTCIQKSANELNVYYPCPHLIFSECYRGDNSSLDTDIQHDFSNLERTIDQRIQDEVDYFKENNVELLKAETIEILNKYIKYEILENSVYYKGTPNETEEIGKNIKEQDMYSYYMIGNECIFIVNKNVLSKIDCYIHRYKNRTEQFNVTLLQNSKEVSFQ
jgi:GR25 family glycosyltransferase involved in LPS biosynthesis